MREAIDDTPIFLRLTPPVARTRPGTTSQTGTRISPGPAVPREHLAEDVAAVGEGRGAKEYPADADQREGQDGAERIEPARRGRFSKSFRPAMRSQTQQRAVIAAPDHEVPTRAVPQAAQQHGQHQIAIGLQRAVPVAAQRNVEIVAQPAGERHVPAMPEIGDAEGQIRAAEIHREMEAEQHRHADGHVGVAGKIEEDLQREGDHAAPGRRARRDAPRRC